MSVNIAEHELPTELCHDGAGSRATDVIIAIQTAHEVGAFAASVASVVHPSHRDLRVHLRTATNDGYASSAQADAVLRAFNIPADRIERFDLDSGGAWSHVGVTDDDLNVQIVALGLIDGQS